MRSRTLLVLAGLTTTVVFSSAGTAVAAPGNAKTSTPLTLVCDNGHSYSAVVNGGNSQQTTFSPAHDLQSRSVLVPTALGESTGTLTDSDGNVIDTFSDPAATKGRAAPRGHAIINCTFTIIQQFTVPEGDPDLEPGTYTVTINGTATGFIPGRG